MPTVAAACDPRRALLSLLPHGALPLETEQELRAFRQRGTTAVLALHGDRIPGVTLGSRLKTRLFTSPIASLGFRYYVVTFGHYTETYGTIGGIIVVLLWFYLSSLAIVIGAELNAEIEHASPWGKEPGEKHPGDRKSIGAAAARQHGKLQLRRAS